MAALLCCLQTVVDVIEIFRVYIVINLDTELFP